MIGDTDRGAQLLGAEIALVGVTLALAVSVTRAFADWTMLAPLAAVGILAHGCSAIARRRNVPAVPATILAIAVGAVVIAVMFYSDTTFVGVPTAETLRRAAEDASTAFAPFRELVPPVAPSTGFTVVLAAAIWLIATFADLAAFRAAAPFQAVAPHIGGFVFSSVLVLGRGAIVASTAMILTVSAFAGAIRAEGRRRPPELSGRTHRFAVARIAAIGVATSFLVAMAVTAVRPPDESRWVDLRAIGRGPDARQVTNPLVSVTAQLGAQSNRVMFEAVSPEPHYWRLTALDTYENDAWRSNDSYSSVDAGEELDLPFGPDLPTRSETVSVKIRDLLSDWLPTPFAPRSLTATVPLRYDTVTSSVLLAEEQDIAGISYRVRAEVTDITDRNELEGRGPSNADELSDDLALPSSVPLTVSQLARELAGLDPSDPGTPDDALAALDAIEQYFRAFSYVRDVDYSKEDSPIDAFLEQREGFCQQFATTFALMARSLGIPARVAVGFSFGDRKVESDPSAPSGERVSWVVRGRHAHAWPEVNIDGIGWVAFEPTPGLGNPANVAWSGIPASNSESADSAAPPTTTTIPGATTTTSTPTGATTTVPNATPTTLAPGTGRSTGGAGSTSLILIGLVVALIVAFGLRVATVRRSDRRFRDPAAPDGERVRASWCRARDDLARIDVTMRPSETPREFARRAAIVLELEGFERLGELETRRRYHPDPPTSEESADAVGVSDAVRAIVYERLRRSEALRAQLGVAAKVGAD